MVSLGAGYNHATAVTESGKLYMWGMKVKRLFFLRYTVFSFGYDW